MTEPTKDTSEEVQMTFGEVLTQNLPIEDYAQREDLMKVRSLYAAILNVLHISLGGNQSGIGNTLLQQSISKTLEAFMTTERALYFCDEYRFEPEKEESK